MKIIKNKQDLDLLSEAKALGSEMSQHLQDFLVELQADLDVPEPGVYTTEDCGHIVLLEAGDNVRDLSNVGLNPEDQGLLGCTPEWIDPITLDDKDYYKLLVLYNDCFGVIFYTAVGSHDQEVEQWLQGALEDYATTKD